MYLYDESKPPVGKVSVSQIQTYMACKKKWEYNYIKRIKPRVDRSYLTIGKLCHKGMQTAMRELWECPSTKEDVLGHLGCAAIEDEWQSYIDSTDYLDEEIPEFEQILEDSKSIFLQALEEFDPCKYEVVTIGGNEEEDGIPALELHFDIPCPPSEGLHGYIDAILKDKTTGFTWCVDYKFRKSLAPDEDEAYNIQNIVYAYACSKIGVDITGTMTWQHLNTPAVDPKVNKDGSISTAKVKTTWSHYKKFCEERGQDPSKYATMEDKLNEVEWYRVTLEYRNQRTIDNVWKDCIGPTTRSIVASRFGSVENYRSMYPWNCRMCQYKSLCQAEVRDYDVDAIIQREYTRR